MVFIWKLIKLFHLTDMKLRASFVATDLWIQVVVIRIVTSL